MGNADTFLRGIQALNRGDLEGMLEVACDDVEIVPLRAFVQGTVYRGAAGVAAFLADNQASFDSFEVTQVSAGVAEYRAGLLARWEDFGDGARARAAAGPGSSG